MDVSAAPVRSPAGGRTHVVETSPPVYRITGIFEVLTRCHRAFMKRSTALVRRTPLRSSMRSRRRTPRRMAMLTRDAATARDLVQERDGCCILCGKPGVDAHHRLPRGGGGASRDLSRFALSRLVWLCRECHCWVESYRTVAEGLGLLVRHGVTPCSKVPVFRRGRWVLLTDGGQVTPTDLPVEVGTPDLGWALPTYRLAGIVAGS